MDTFFDEIKARLQTLFNDATSIKSHFDIAADHIELTKPLKLATVELFFVHLFGEEAALPELPFGEATINRLAIARSDTTVGLPTRADIAVSFNGSATWHAAPDLELGLTSFAIDYWGGSITGRVSGSVTVKDLEFDATIEWPSMAVTGHLATKPSKPHDFAGLIERHGIDPGPANTKPSVDMLRLNAAPRIQALRIDVAGSNLGAIGPVHLDAAALSIDYHGGPNAAFVGEVSAEFSVDLPAASLAFGLRGAKTVKGWEAEAIAVGSSTIGSVVDGLAAHLYPGGRHSFVDSGVPADLANVAVSGAISLKVSTADKHATIMVAIDVSNGAGTMAFEVDVAPKALVIRAELHIADMAFEVDFAKNDTGMLLAAQFASEHALEIHLADLVKLAHLDGGTSSLQVGADVKIGVRDVLIAMASPAALANPQPANPPAGGNQPSKSKYLVAADIDGGVDLSGLGDLPIIGTMLPRDLSLRLSLAPILITQSWADQQDALDELRGDNGPHLPAKLDQSSLGVSLQLPGAEVPVDMGLSLGDTSSGDDVAIDTPAAAGPTPAAADSPLTWKTINKSLGPISIERVGLGLDKTKPTDPQVRVLLDSSLGLGPLSLSLIGLGAHYGLKSKELGVELHGMGIDFHKPPLEIGGAFAKIGDDYLGKVKIQLKQIGLAASGGFTTIDGAPSMFIYGVLTTPLGGPPFFFVQGLAAGFGFNRQVTTPELNQIHSFPFVADAIDVADGGKAPTMSESLNALATYIQPSVGDYFLAAGVKFTSFKLIDSFILVVLSAGRELKLDAIGISSYQTPPLIPAGLPAMVRIELEVSVAVRPAQGFVRVQASLTNNSYVYSPVVRLSGGFAFQAWFAGPNAGDFVLSAGGYHPDFNKPEHYPDVNRIALTFKVPGFDVYIKGQAYLALTPSSVMAGGSLEAVANFGKVHASFRLYLDVMVQWEPYHYDARIGIAIHARWWKLSTTAHAELHIWGPEFAGIAHVDWSVISFDVDFGPGNLLAQMGMVPPISWSKFQDSFLPHDKPKGNAKPGAKVAPTAVVAAGEISVLDGPNGPIHVVNPKDLVIAIESVMPIDALKVTARGSQPVTEDVKVGNKAVSIGCGPVGISTIKGSELELAFAGPNDFDHTVEIKQFPAAMWGPPGKPEPNAERTVSAGGSVELRPKDAVKHWGKARVLRRDFAYDSEGTKKVAKSAAFEFAAGSKKLEKALATPTAKPRKARNEVLASLGLAPERHDVRPEFTTELRGTPTTMAVQ